jgi:hypothetical protein
MKQTIWIAMLMILIASASAEIFTSNRATMDNSAKTYTKFSYLSYPTYEGQFQGSLPLQINLFCQDIGTWNSDNPDYQVSNVLLLIQYTQMNFFYNVTFLASEPVYTTYFQYKGCDSSPTCDPSNTPASQFFDYNFYNGEMLTIRMTTYFNSTFVTDESPCQVGINLNSENCRGCEVRTYQQTVDLLSQREQNFEVKSTIYGYVNNLIDLNFTIWSIIYYILMIGILVCTILGIFYMIFWVPDFIKREFGGK